MEVSTRCSPSLLGWPVCAGSLRAWLPATAFHGVWDSAGPARVPGLLLVSAASPSMDHEHGTVCQSILEHQIRLCAPSSVISRLTCFSSSLRCCWLVRSFVRRRCDCLASSAPFTNTQTYLFTYLQIFLSLLIHTVDCTQFLSENRLNGYQIFGLFGFKKPNPNWFLVFRTVMEHRALTSCLHCAPSWAVVCIVPHVPLSSPRPTQPFILSGSINE